MSQTSLTTKLDCSHAMGTNTFSSQRAESFRYFLLLLSPSFVYHGREPTNIRVRLGVRAGQLQASRLRVRSHAGSRPPFAKRATTRWPLKPAFGLSGNVDWLSKTQSYTLADALKSLKQGVSRRLIGSLPLKPKAGLSRPPKHFWEKRYYDFNIRKHTRRLWEKLRYVHPVKRGLCGSPEEWEWGSFRHYATGHQGRIEIESEWTVRKRELAAGGLLSTSSNWPTQAKIGL